MFRNRFIGPGSLSLIAFVAIGLAVELPAASAQTAPRSPADTLIQFYKLMRERHYREAFAISIYRPAVDGLTQQEFEDLQSDFDKMAAGIPEKIEVAGEQVDDGGYAAACDGVGGHVQDMGKETHQRLCHIEVVVVGGAHEGGHRAEAAQLEVAGGRHKLLLHRAIEGPTAAPRLR